MTHPMNTRMTDLIFSSGQPSPLNMVEHFIYPPMDNRNKGPFRSGWGICWGISDLLLCLKQHVSSQAGKCAVVERRLVCSSKIKKEAAPQRDFYLCVRQKRKSKGETAHCSKGVYNRPCQLHHKPGCPILLLISFLVPHHLSCFCSSVLGWIIRSQGGSQVG